MSTVQPKRVLACVLCQQRKVKCDRKFPCANCVKSRAQCVPGSQIQRRRRRRFPEKELLDRLRKYEDLLRQHNIEFEPLHKNSNGDKEVHDLDSGHDSDDNPSEIAVSSPSAGSTKIKAEKGNESESVLHTISRGFRDPGNESDSSEDDVRDIAIRKAWEQSALNDDHLLFGLHGPNVNLSSYHPDPVQIFRLWQVYLDNVNPLLKVTHTPSMQGRIIEAAGNVANIEPTLEALMFSIYCMAILSLNFTECQAIFGCPKKDLLTRYQSGCQQALSKCHVLQTNDRDCLTALFLYLASVRHTTIAHSLSSMLAVAVRIANRMGIHNEAALAKCTILEAEMRRRLWWALVIFDTRVCETTNSKISTLDPTWDCSIPLNINDSDLRPEMKSRPATLQNPMGETLFAVLRSTLGDFVRHCEFHLNFTCPAWKLSTWNSQIISSGTDGLVKLEDTIETQYFKACDAENPIHFVTMWTIRGQLAKYRVLEHHAASFGPQGRRTPAERDDATTNALRMLECDTIIMNSPLAKGFRWFNQLNYPFLAYLHIVQDLKKRPANEHNQRAWDMMSDNFDAWADDRYNKHSPFFQLLGKMVLSAWAACEAAASMQPGLPRPLPRLVETVRWALGETVSYPSTTESLATPDFSMDTEFGDFTLPIQMDLADQNMVYSNMGVHGGFNFASMGMYNGVQGSNLPDSFLTQFNWTDLSK